MVETAETLIKDVMDDVSISAAEAPIEPADWAILVRALNRLMAALSADDIVIGYTPVANTSDVITIPEGAVDAVITLLAARVWKKFRGEAKPADLMIRAAKARRLLSKIGRTSADQSFPSTLPVGSGNTGGGSYGSVFYPDQATTLNTEYNQTISAEDDTDE